MGGAHLEQRFRDAGFVDIKVEVKNIIIGEWETGNPQSILYDKTTNL